MSNSNDPRRNADAAYYKGKARSAVNRRSNVDGNREPKPGTPLPPNDEDRNADKYYRSGGAKSRRPEPLHKATSRRQAALAPESPPPQPIEPIRLIPLEEDFVFVGNEVADDPLFVADVPEPETVTADEFDDYEVPDEVVVPPLTGEQLDASPSLPDSIATSEVGTEEVGDLPVELILPPVTTDAEDQDAELERMLAEESEAAQISEEDKAPADVTSVAKAEKRKKGKK